MSEGKTSTPRSTAKSAGRVRTSVPGRDSAVSPAEVGIVGKALGLQRALGNDTVSTLLRGVAPEAPVSTAVANVLKAGGTSLEPTTKAHMEDRLGHDFSGVRIHVGEQAAESARAVRAIAYTVGQHVVFDHGRYAPHSTSGLQLLAHELTHVVQQRNGGPPPSGAAHSPLETEAHSVGVRLGNGAGSVSISGRSGVGLARAPNTATASAGKVAAEAVEESGMSKLLEEMAEAAKPLTEAEIAKTIDHMAEVSNRYGKLRGTIDDVLKDPAVQQRLADIAARSGKAEDVIPALRGELTEQAMNREIRARLETGVDLDTILPKEVSPEGISFIEGDRIRDLNGEKLTDGMLVRRRGNQLEIITVFETKAGEASARGIHLKGKYAKDPAKLRAEGIEPTPKQLEEWEHLQKVKQETPKGKVKQTELGGQIRQDIERLHADGKIRIHKLDEAGKILPEFEVAKVRVSRRTLFLGAAPADVSLKAQAKSLAKEPGIRFKPWNLNARKREIATAAKQLREATAKLGGGPGGAGPGAGAGAGQPKPAAQAPEAKPSAKGAGAPGAGQPAKPAAQPPPKPKAAEAPEAKPKPAEPEGKPQPPAKKPAAPAAEAKPAAVAREPSPAKPITPELETPAARRAAEIEAVLPERQVEKALAEATEVVIEKKGGQLGREVVSEFLQKRLAWVAGRRVGSLVPLLGWYSSYLDAKEGVDDIAHGHVLLGLYSIGLAGVDVVADVLHAGDAVSGPGGTALSLTVQGWTTAQQMAIASGRADIRARELGDYLEKHGELPPAKELMEYYGLNDEEVLLLQSDVAKSKLPPKISPKEVRDRLLKRIGELEKKVETEQLSMDDVKALQKERDELLALIPSVEEAVRLQEQKDKERKEKEERAERIRLDKKWREWDKQMRAKRAKKQPEPPPQPKKPLTLDPLAYGPPPVTAPSGRAAGPSPGEQFGLTGGVTQQQEMTNRVEGTMFGGRSILMDGYALRKRLGSGDRPSEAELTAYFALQTQYLQAARAVVKDTWDSQLRQKLEEFLHKIEPQLAEVRGHLGG